MRSRKRSNESKSELEGAAENNMRSSSISMILRLALNSYTSPNGVRGIRKEVFEHCREAVVVVSRSSVAEQMFEEDGQADYAPGKAPGDQNCLVILRYHNF